MRPGSIGQYAGSGDDWIPPLKDSTRYRVFRRFSWFIRASLLRSGIFGGGVRAAVAPWRASAGGDRRVRFAAANGDHSLRRVQPFGAIGSGTSVTTVQSGRPQAGGGRRP